MLTTVARDQRWPDVVAEISVCVSIFFFCMVLLYLTGPLGNTESVLFPSYHNFEVSGIIEILGKQNSPFPSGSAILYNKC